MPQCLLQVSGRAREVPGVLPCLPQLGEGAGLPGRSPRSRQMPSASCRSGRARVVPDRLPHVAQVGEGAGLRRAGRRAAGRPDRGDMADDGLVPRAVVLQQAARPRSAR